MQGAHGRRLGLPCGLIRVLGSGWSGWLGSSRPGMKAHWRLAG